ncbi:MAG: TetR/AcrR family transcriptional regulator [Bacteroidota bacterium]
MKPQKDNSTEQKILDAAEEVFHEKGYDGARMQEIADKATINKGLLHYYFKSKDLLFDAIFNLALRRMISNLQEILEMDNSLEEKIELIIDAYMNLLSRNSALPRFVINELNKDPDKFIAKHLNQNLKNVFTKFNDCVKKEIAKGKIKAIDSRQLFMNIISMIIFPYVGRPMIQVVVGIENKEFYTLMHERRDLIKQFVKQALRP